MSRAPRSVVGAVLALAIHAGLYTPLASAAGGTTALIPLTSDAAPDSGEVNVFGPNRFNLMVCGVGFTGSYTVFQGPTTGKLAQTKSVNLSGYTSCSEYRWFEPSTLVKVTASRSAGQLEVFLEYFPARAGP